MSEHNRQTGTVCVQTRDWSHANKPPIPFCLWLCLVTQVVHRACADRDCCARIEVMSAFCLLIIVKLDADRISLDSWHKNSPLELHSLLTLQPWTNLTQVLTNLMQVLINPHTTPTMADSTLLALPQELKIKIFEQLFHNTRVVICRVPLKGLEQCNILYTCRQLYFDARPVLADFIKISIIGMGYPLGFPYPLGSPALGITRPRDCLGIPKTLQPYYRPRIQDITVDIGIGLGLVNFQEFSNLKVLHTRRNFRRPLGLSACTDMEQSRRILAGRLDQEMKERTRAYYATSSPGWFAKAIADPDRKYKIMVHSNLEWSDHNHGHAANVATASLVRSF